MINFDNGHSTVIGITRSGKTFATKKSLINVDAGVLFFNTQWEDMPTNFINVNGNDSIALIKKALETGKKINYIPSLDAEIRGKEIIFLVNMLYSRKNLKKIYFVVDEVHLYEKQALKELIKVATTGLRFGINGIWISQRPANVDNTLMTQSNQFVIFKTNMESEYFKRYGIPNEDIKNRLEKGGEYSYCIYDFNNLIGPFKI